MGFGFDSVQSFLAFLISAVSTFTFFFVSSRFCFASVKESFNLETVPSAGIFNSLAAFLWAAFFANAFVFLSDAMLSTVETSDFEDDPGEDSKGLPLIGVVASSSVFIGEAIVNV